MNKKERVSAVLDHKQPDSIPIGMYAIDCDTVKKILGRDTYVRNKAGQTLALWEGRRDEVVQSLKEDSVELFNKLDCIDIVIPYKEASILPAKDYEVPKMKKIEDNVWEDEKGIIYKYSELSNEIGAITHISPDYTMEDFEKDIIARKPDETMFEVYNHFIEQFKDKMFLAGKAASFEPLLIFGGLSCMDKGLMDYILRPELIEKAIEYNTKLSNLEDELYISKDIDAVFIEQDMAGSNGPLMSPTMFEDFCFDAMKSRIDSIKRYKEKVLFHCCGKTLAYMDMFRDTGIDCYQSLQTGAGMDIGLLKENYGKDMAFWGGVAVENLVSGTMEDVRADVRYAMNSCKDNGGFILGPSHSIAFGTKYDNFMAMLDEHNNLK